MSAECTEDSYKYEYEGVLEAKTRYLVFITEMPGGAQIGLTYACEESEAIRVGLKNLSTGDLTYEEEWAGGITYTVPTAGTYAIYIENGLDHDLNGYVAGRYGEPNS